MYGGDIITVLPLTSSIAEELHRELITLIRCCFNPIPHIDAFWRFCSRQLAFWKQCDKRRNCSKFLLLPQCFPLLVIDSIIAVFYFLTKYVQSRLLQNCRMRESVKEVLLWRGIIYIKRNLLGQSSSEYTVLFLSIQYCFRLL